MEYVLSFKEIVVLHRDGDFYHGAPPEYVGQFVLIRIFVKEPSQLIVHLKGFVHHLVRNRAERLLVKDMEIFSKFDWHGKILP
jgi:hypothetical protein